MRQLRYALMLLVVLAMVAAACSSDDSETTTTAAAGGDDTTETTAAMSEGTDMAGAEFTLFGAPQAAELDAAIGFVDVYNSEKGSSITVEGSDSYETQIRIRVEGGNAPVVSFTPQPSMVCEFADMGELISLEDMGFDIAELEATRGKFMMDLGLCDDGKHYGVPWYPNFKSIVFYNKAVFAEKGYEIPTTYADMVTLSGTMVSDGYAPWCFGYESDAATGWAGTDWIEDIAVRMIGADKYLQWTKGELRFDTPEIKAVFEKFNEILFGDGFVLGGAENIAATNFRDSPLPMFNDPPSCLMLKQGSFISNFFPEGRGDEVGTFAFPSIDGVGGALGGGDTLMVFQDDPQAIQFVKDVIEPDWMCTHASAT
ncbi:MAG: ABC transporter substrate-binding protein, partial [Actinomycetota bacterium]|nr:ABC transporter substrate-binding protein [Actinomycetota bacterium]